MAAFDFVRGFSVDVEPLRDEVSTVRVRGELDLASAGTLTARIESIVRDGRTRIVFDATELTFVDSTGLEAIIGARNRVHQAGSDFVLVPSRPLTRLLEVSGTAGLFRSFPTVESAAGVMRDEIARAGPESS